MATKEVATNTNYLYMCVDYSTSIVGDYPNIKFRFTYKMRFHLTAQGSVQYTNATFKFGSNSDTFTVNFSAGNSGGYSPYLVSNTIDYAWGDNRSSTKSPSFSTSFGNVSANGSISATQTIPDPTLEASVKEVTPYTASFNIDLSSNPNSFYKVKMLNGDTVLLDNAEDGAIVEGLAEETEYTLNVVTWAITDTGSKVTEVPLTFTTLVDQARMLIKNSTWKKGKAFLKVSGSWKKAKKIYLKKSGSWVKSVN